MEFDPGIKHKKILIYEENSSRFPKISTSITFFSQGADSETK